MFPLCVLLVGTHYMSEYANQCKPERTSLLSASVSHFEKPRQEQQCYTEHHDDCTGFAGNVEMDRHQKHG